MTSAGQATGAKSAAGPHHHRDRERLWHLPPWRWPALARRVFRESARDRVTTIAGSLAFHGFLALLPVVIATVGFLNLVGLSGAQLRTLVHDTSVLLPAQMSSVLNHDLLAPPSHLTNVFEVVLGLAVALWSSVEAMAALQVALDVAYEVSRDRGLIGRRLMAFPLLGITIGLGGVASVLLVLGRPLGHLLPGALHPALSVVRYGGSFVLVTLLLSALYTFGAAHNEEVWEWVSPGAVLAAVGWVLTSLGFSFYLDHFGHESRTYGALAGVAVTLLWLFLTGVIVLLGAELNRELERMAAEGAGGPPTPTTAATEKATPTELSSGLARSEALARRLLHVVPHLRAGRSPEPSTTPEPSTSSRRTEVP